MAAGEDVRQLEHFANAQGKAIFCRRWNISPDLADKPRALVLILHGFCEHSGWYDHIAKLLQQAGILAFAHDHVGHGKSEGERAYISNMQHLIDDVLQHVDIIRDQYPDLPLFIIGHSMGGAIAILSAVALGDRLNGLVLIGPLVIGDTSSFNSVLVSLVNVIAYLCPHVPLSKLDKSFMCRDPEIIEKYLADPLNYVGGVRARTAVCLIDVQKEVQSNLHAVTCPILTIHGDADRLCSVHGAQMLNTIAKSEDKTLQIIEGGYHQVHNEPDGVGEKCRQTIVDWISERI